jgi:hypothetical protein
LQDSEKGLAGNFIRQDVLQDRLTEYLKTTKEAQSAPSIAMVMIDQLRERNFVLCSLDDEAYGFIHHTFLEYFCASEMVYQFEKQRTLSFEQLRDQVFGQHWQDETWHEVLRLICGMVDASFAGQLIEFLINQKASPAEDKQWLREEGALKKIGKANLLLAMDCCAEVSQLASIAPTRNALLEAFQQVLRQGVFWQVVEEIVNLVAKAPRFPEGLPWLKDQVLNDRSDRVYSEALEAIAQHYYDDPATLPWLKDCFQADQQERVRRVVVMVIDRIYPNHLDEQMRKWL